VLGFIFGDLSPVKEELDRKTLAVDLSVSKARDDVPSKINGVLLNVGERVFYQRPTEWECSRSMRTRLFSLPPFPLKVR
jgi:hypothetical protein